jgi:hypothetical protein
VWPEISPTEGTHAAQDNSHWGKEVNYMLCYMFWWQEGGKRVLKTYDHTKFPDRSSSSFSIIPTSEIHTAVMLVSLMLGNWKIQE